MWILWSFLAGLMGTAYVSVNQFFKIPAGGLMVFSGLGGALILMPFLFLSIPKVNTEFYLFCILQGINVGYLNNRFLNAAKKYGAQTTAMLQPLSVVGTFFLWLLINPIVFMEYVKYPILSFGITVCLMGIVISVFFLRKQKDSAQVFKALFIPLCALTLSDVLNKKAMQAVYGEMLPAIIYYCFIVAFFSGISNVSILLKDKSLLMSKKTWIGGGCLIILWIFMMFFKNLAMKYGSNPAYISALIISTSFSVVIFNEICHFFKPQYASKVRTNPKVLFLLLICVVGLVVLTS